MHNNAFTMKLVKPWVFNVFQAERDEAEIWCAYSVVSLRTLPIMVGRSPSGLDDLLFSAEAFLTV